MTPTIGWLVVAVALSVAPWPACGQDKSKTIGKLKLGRAVMCESIREYEPAYPAVLFSIERGKISCFTKFDQVPEKTYIHHKWYRRDSLITVKRLTIKPPRWSSFTSVQLRDADKGPWRVEITDGKDNLMHTLRFSITE